MGRGWSSSLMIVIMIMMIIMIDGPRLVEQPATVSGDLGDSVTLRCRVDSNPPATYTWTRGTSRQVRGGSNRGNQITLHTFKQRGH